MRDLDLGLDLATRAATAIVREASRLATLGGERRLVVNGSEWRVHVGSSYFALSAECVDHLLATVDRHAEIRHFFRRSFVAEAMIWHTVLMNSPFRDRFAQITETFALDQFAATHHFDYHGEVKVIGLDRLDRALASGKLFGRKFATGPSDAALARMDALWRGAAST